MKVPKMYKSSDLYNAGTDVIYNDESKLQYAPFIYATTQSGDSGEGGEDTMVVAFSYSDGTPTIDKTWLEISNACVAGKNVIGYYIPSDWYEIPDGDSSTTIQKYDLSFLQHNVNEATSQENFTVNFTDNNGELLTFIGQNASDIPEYVSGDD